VDPVTVTLEDGQRETISSSRIRRAIAEHDLPLAMRALGRPYTLVGRVVHGKGRGRRLGFPTANLDLGRQMIPPNGVYAGKATLGNEKYLAAISIGHAPTFADVADAFVEAHLLDFDREVYGQVLRVEVHHWLRAQAAYGSAQALCDQMAEDVRTVRRMVRDTPGEAA
jgi:riboflavin kinase/FMN adenylyltransferase